MSDNNSAATPSFGNVWRVTITGKKKEGVTDEEFARRYALHGKLAGPVVARNNGISYRLLKEKLRPEHLAYLAPADIDGVSTLIFPTGEDLAGFISDPEYGAKLVADASEFGDVTSIKVAVGNELVVVEDGKFVL